MTSDDKALKLLRLRLRAGAVVPFVGAGVSRAVQKRSDGNHAFPSWKELLDTMANDLDAAEQRKPAALVRAHLLDPPDYLLAAQVARDRIPEARWTPLLQRLLDVPRTDVETDSLALARAIWSLSRFVVTTNYDRVLSWAGRDELQVDPRVVNIQDSKEALLEAINRTLHHPTVWHVHGHIDDAKHIVLAPESYDSIYQASGKGQSQFEAARSVLRMILAARCLLFIGFSLDDLYFAEQVSAIAQVFDGKGGPHFVLLRREDIDKKRDQLAALGVLPVPYENHGEPLIRTIREFAQAVRPLNLNSELREESESSGDPLDDKQIELAASYLAPGLTIETNDAIADHLRALAASTNYDTESIKNAAIGEAPAHRVAAYIALQMRSSPGLSDLFAVALHREIAEVVVRNETRPLWQLLLAIDFAMESQTIGLANLATLGAAISSSIVVLDRLAQANGVDPGGECRRRLRDVAEALAQATTEGLSLPAAQRMINEFAARNALRVGAPSIPILSVSGAQAFVAEEDDEMGLVYCYVTGWRKGTVAWVRKGIGWYCRKHADVVAPLGFPLGREETMAGGAFSRFERGFIEWVSSGSRVRAYLHPYPDRSHPLGESVRI